MGLLGLLTLGSQWRTAITITLVGTVVCLSLVVLTGFLGQISLAQMTIAGVAGFTLSKLVTDWNVPFPVGPLAGAAVAALFGLLTAIPALRVRGVNLAVVTLAFAVTIENFVFKNSSWNGGLNGAAVPPPRLFGLQFGPNDVTSFGDGKLPNPFFGVFCLVVVVLLGLVVVNLRRSITGRQMLAVRSNERGRGRGRDQRLGHQDARVRAGRVRRRARRCALRLQLRLRDRAHVREHRVARRSSRSRTSVASPASRAP